MMESLNEAYDSSDEERQSGNRKPSPASAIMEKLRRVPLNSAPAVPVKVCTIFCRGFRGNIF